MLFQRNYASQMGLCLLITVILTEMDLADDVYI